VKLISNRKGEASLALETRGIEPIPADERTHGWWDLTIIFIGIFSHLVVFAVGADYVQHLGLWRTILCVALGCALVMPFFVTGGWISARYGIPGSVAMRIAFGTKGSWIPSIINAFVAMGWFALQTSISALAFDKIILYFGGGSHFLLWVIVWGIVYCINALFGYGFITSFARYAVPALYLMFTYVTYQIASTEGLAKILAFVPTSQGLSFLFLMDAIFGGFGGTSSTLVADYCRYAKNRRVTLSAGLTAIVVSTFIVSLGAMATLVTGNSDITASLLALGMGLTAMVVVIFATWTTNPCNTYSASLSLSNVTGWNRVTSVLAMGTVGVALAVWGILEHMTDFLSVVGLSLAPANAILLVEYFFFSRQKVRTDALFEKSGCYHFWGGTNPAAVIAWGIGSITVFLLNFTLHVDWLTLPALFSCILAGVLYGTLRWISIVVRPEWRP
jgi:NCS1 nucleoside transporter family